MSKKDKCTNCGGSGKKRIGGSVFRTIFTECLPCGGSGLKRDQERIAKAMDTGKPTFTKDDEALRRFEGSGYDT